MLSINSTTQCPQIIAQFDRQVIGKPEPTWHNAQCEPFHHPDIFNSSLQFMGYGDIFACAQVCKLWNKVSNHPSIWQQFFRGEKIPFVEEGLKSNYKEEFRVLCPRTISKKMGERLFGNFPEELPYISREIFEKFYQPDPFDPEKLMMDTFQIVVIPSIIERIKEFPYILDQKGKLQPVEPGKWTGETLLIPNTIPNLKILCENPLFGKENMPVFEYFSNEVLNQCNTHSDKISLCFMRIDIVGRNKSYSEQKALVEGHGFEVTSLEKRSYFNAVSILRSGTCPDGREPWSYARTSNAVVVGGDTYQSVIGGFAPGSGARVDNLDDYDYGFIGVAPGGPAEVLR